MRLSAAEAYEKYADRVFGLAFSVCRDRADADDVTQDTFMRYLDRGQDYRDEDHLKAWLLRVAVNRARDVTRAFWRRNRVPWEDHMAELPFEEPADRAGMVNVVAGDAKIYMPMAELVDLDKERERITKELAKARKDIEYQEKKLATRALSPGCWSGWWPRSGTSWPRPRPWRPTWRRA